MALCRAVRLSRVLGTTAAARFLSNPPAMAVPPCWDKARAAHFEGDATLPAWLREGLVAPLPGTIWPELANSTARQ